MNDLHLTLLTDEEVTTTNKPLRSGGLSARNLRHVGAFEDEGYCAHAHLGSSQVASGDWQGRFFGARKSGRLCERRPPNAGIHGPQSAYRGQMGRRLFTPNAAEIPSSEAARKRLRIAPPIHRLQCRTHTLDRDQHPRLHPVEARRYSQTRRQAIPRKTCSRQGGLSPFTGKEYRTQPCELRVYLFRSASRPFRKVCLQ